MQRTHSFVKLHRELVIAHGHPAATVADCLRYQIEFHLTGRNQVDDLDERYIRIVDGLVFLRASASFFADHIFYDRSTVRKNLKKLAQSKVVTGRLLTSRNDGNWYAFTAEFLSTTNDFFDSGARKKMIQLSTPGADEIPTGADVDNSKTGADEIPTSADEIRGGADEIPTSADEIPTGLIYNTNPTPSIQTLHPKGERNFVNNLDFLNATDEQYREQIIAVIAKYDASNPVAMVKACFGWNRCADNTAIMINKLKSDYGFAILCAAAVIAFNTREVDAPLRFIEGCCKRLLSQQTGNHRRKKLATG